MYLDAKHIFSEPDPALFPARLRIIESQLPMIRIRIHIGVLPVVGSYLLEKNPSYSFFQNWIQFRKLAWRDELIYYFSINWLLLKEDEKQGAHIRTQKYVRR